MPHVMLGEQLGHETSPEGAARQCWGATWGRNVALEMNGSLRTHGRIHGGIFGYGILLECRSRVPHGTHGEQLKHETSPEGVTRHPLGTILT